MHTVSCPEDSHSSAANEKLTSSQVFDFVPFSVLVLGDILLFGGDDYDEEKLYTGLGEPATSNLDCRRIEKLDGAGFLF